MPALPTMNYEASLAYDDDEWGSDSDPTEDAADEAKAVNSKTGQLVVAILNGSVPTHSVGPSGSNSVEGRVLDIRLALKAEFRLALRMLDQAHDENNVYKGNLLSSIRRYISTCHKTASKSKVQLSSLRQWRVPDWAEKVKYNHESGTVIPSGIPPLPQDLESTWTHRQRCAQPPSGEHEFPQTQGPSTPVGGVVCKNNAQTPQEYNPWSHRMTVRTGHPRIQTLRSAIQGEKEGG